MPEKRCDICGAYELLPYTCSYCGGTFCSEHRLPERHACPGLGLVRQRRAAGRAAPTPRGSPIARPVPALPLQGFYAYGILGLTILVFILQVLIPGLTGLLILDASTIIERPWGAVTSIFLHSGISHLFFNMLALFFFGPVLERRVGSGRFLGLYLGSGIIAGLAQVLVFPGSAVLGASGAIFGVLGTLAILTPDLIVYLYFVPLRMAYAVVLFAALDLYPVLLNTADGIGHIAHLSGLAIGLAAGLYYRQKRI